MCRPRPSSGCRTNGEPAPAKPLLHRVTAGHEQRGDEILALAVQHPLRERQEGDELVVMPLLEVRGTAELVLDFAPGIRRAVGEQDVPVIAGFFARHQLQRPDQDLAEVTHDTPVIPGTGLAMYWAPFVAAAGPDVPLREARKNCQVNVDLAYPAGWQFAVSVSRFAAAASRTSG